MEYWLKEAHVQKANLSLFLITISIDSVDLPCVWEMVFKKLNIKKLNMFTFQKNAKPLLLSEQRNSSIGALASKSTWLIFATRLIQNI